MNFNFCTGKPCKIEMQSVVVQLQSKYAFLLDSIECNKLKHYD